MADLAVAQPIQSQRVQVHASANHSTFQDQSPVSRQSSRQGREKVQSSDDPRCENLLRSSNFQTTGRISVKTVVGNSLEDKATDGYRNMELCNAT